MRFREPWNHSNIRKWLLDTMAEKKHCVFKPVKLGKPKLSASFQEWLQKYMHSECLYLMNWLHYYSSLTCEYLVFKPDVCGRRLHTPSFLKSILLDLFACRYMCVCVSVPKAINNHWCDIV